MLDNSKHEDFAGLEECCDYKNNRCCFTLIWLVPRSHGLQAEEKKKSLPLVDQAFHDATEKETERLREIMSVLALDQSVLERFAYRCEGFLSGADQPERFVSIHAVDRELDAVRHVVRRKFTDDDDPILTFTITQHDGYGDSRIDNGRFFPISNDKLRLGEKVFLSNDKKAGIPRDQVEFTGQDRNFNPVTCSMLPLSNFFYGSLSKKPLFKIYDIDRLTADKVALVGKSFITKDKDRMANGKPSNTFTFKDYTDGLPRNYEVWLIAGNFRKLICRTTTEWGEIRNQPFPVRMEAIQITGSRTEVLDLSLSWRFNKEVPDRLFEVSDVGSKDALQW